MTHPEKDDRPGDRGATTGRTLSFGRVLFAGLDCEGVLFLGHHRPVPVASLPSVAALAGALLEDGVETPDSLARYLSRFDPMDARGYSQAIWNALCVVNVANTSSPDWAEIYGRVDAQSVAANVTADTGRPAGEDTGESDPRSDDFASVKLWAEEVGEDIAGIERILVALRNRPGTQPDLTDAVGEMIAALESVHDGRMPMEMWRVELILNQGDKTTGGRWTFSIAIDGEGVDAQSTVLICQPGQLDCCGGDDFRLRLGERGHGNGDFIAFASEFEEAIANPIYVLTVQFGDEEVGSLPQVSPSNSEGERIANRLIRRFVGELQEIDDTMSGDDSGLENVWDEICVQKQIEESFGWVVYETTARALIAEAVEEMPREERVKLWLLTEPGEDWEVDKESPDELPSPRDADVADFLFDRLMSFASDYLNHRIIRYRDRPQD